MKGFKHNKKAATTTVNGSAQTRVAHPELKTLLPGLGIAAGGLLLAAALLWFGIISGSRQQHSEQLIQAWGGFQAGVLQQALNQLGNETQRAAGNPQLLQALHSADPEQIAAAERSLAYRDGVVDAQLNLKGQAKPDKQRAAPMNFATLDMLQRAENGKQPAAEAYRVGERWLVYSVAPLRASTDQAVQGTLLLVVDLQRLLALLPAMPAGAGQLQVSQQFGSTPAQLLFSLGEETPGPRLELPSDIPHWKFSFAPGQYAGSALTDALVALAALLLALLGALLGLRVVAHKARQSLDEDAGQLQQMVDELASGKPVKPFSLSLPVLDELAKSLARLPQRRIEPSSKPAPAVPIQEVGTGTSEADGNSPAEQVDTLDIDIIDDSLPPVAAESTATAPQSDTRNQRPNLPASIFRAYDIRGVIGTTLTSDTAYWIGRAIGSESLARGEPSIVVARDGRLSGPQLVQSLIQGLVDCGCRVIDLGMVPTPVLYFATHVLEARSGVMVTGSHNPPDYNGFKIVIAGDTLANEEITALHTRIQHNELASGAGSVEQQPDILERYLRQITDDIAIAKTMKVVVDCGNGVAGVIAPRLLEALGCSVIPLFCEVDGNFPNHHPDPGKLENLQDLIARVKEEGADLGLAFDGDGDRVGVVTNQGQMIYPDRLMMLFAKDVVSRNPGADVIFDVKCSRRLGSLIRSYGGRPIMWKTGHSLIKQKMKETGALLAGEMSGHIFFKERWFGFDDGIYSAARLLEILSLETRDAELVFASFASGLSTPEINITVTDEGKFELIERLQSQGQWGEANLTLLDGIRVDYAKGWGLVRASNTTPVLVLRFEADTSEELERIQDVFRVQLQQVAPDLNLTF